MTNIPHPKTFTRAPLRNRLRVKLNAPAGEVWALVGDLERLPEYSAGLARVETKADANGRCESFTCYFKPTEEGVEGAVARDRICWWEPQRGWASKGVEADGFGLKNDLNLMFLDEALGGATLTWDIYFDAEDLGLMKAHYDEALADIGENLVRRFGGQVMDRYVEA